MKHFTLAEFCRSTTADRLGINNTIPQSIVPNIEALVENVLDPLREWYGKPINISSGYRSDALNKAVGGAATSQHAKGQAADIDTGSKESNKKLFDYIRAHLEFDQLIDEKNMSWVHVSFRNDGKNREQILKL